MDFCNLCKYACFLAMELGKFICLAEFFLNWSLCSFFQYAPLSTSVHREFAVKCISFEDANYSDCLHTLPINDSKDISMLSGIETKSGISVYSISSSSSGVNQPAISLTVESMIITCQGLASILK